MNSSIFQPSVCAEIILLLHDDGSMAIHGNVGDVNMAMRMVDAAREAIAHRKGKPCILEPHGAGLELSNRDAGISPNERIYPLIALGDRKA